MNIWYIVLGGSLLAVVALLLTTFPDILRYFKIRSM
jgi:hypothetical protein